MTDTFKFTSFLFNAFLDIYLSKSKKQLGDVVTLLLGGSLTTF